MKFKELKQKLKEMAVEIRVMKNKRKNVPDGYVPGLDRLRYDVRHHHIAYCLLRGRTIEEIERTTREDNPRNVRYYTEIMNSIEPREEKAA